MVKEKSKIRTEVFLDHKELNEKKNFTKTYMEYVFVHGNISLHCIPLHKAALQIFTSKLISANIKFKYDNLLKENIYLDTSYAYYSLFH